MVAVDVGRGQLVEPLRSDPRVRLLEQTNLRELTLAHVEHRPVPLVVGDVSFISLTLLLRPLNVETLATSIYQYASRGSFEDGALAALLIVAASIGPVAWLTRFSDVPAGPA